MAVFAMNTIEMMVEIAVKIEIEILRSNNGYRMKRYNTRKRRVAVGASPQWSGMASREATHNGKGCRRRRDEMTFN